MWNEAKSTLVTYQEETTQLRCLIPGFPAPCSLHRWKAAPISTQTFCLIVTLLFNVLFRWYFPLFYLPIFLYIVDLLISFLCALLSLQGTPPCYWLATSVFWDSVRCWSKAFFKTHLVHLKIRNQTSESLYEWVIELFTQCICSKLNYSGMNETHILCSTVTLFGIIFIDRKNRQCNWQHCV